MIQKSEKDIEERKTLIGSIILALFYLLAQYLLPIMSYGFILLLIYGVGVLFINRVFYINKPILIFIIAAIVQQSIIYLCSGTLAQNRNTYLFMFVCAFLLGTLSQINKQDFFKAYYIVGLITSIAVLIQFVMANCFGKLQSTIRILPVSENDIHYWMQESNRVSGFFTEPQAYSGYIIPLLIYLLSKCEVKKALFFSFAILASTSSQGIILMLICWIYYFFAYEKNNRKKLLIIAVGLILVVAFSLTGVFQYTIEKIMSINIFGYDIRLTKGFGIFFEMPIQDKILGIGKGNLREYLLNGNFNFFWMSLTKDVLFDYVTTMSDVLISYGMFVFPFYIFIFVYNIKNSSKDGKLFLLIIFIASFTQTLLFNAWFVFYWSVYQIMDNQADKRYIFFSLEDTVCTLREKYAKRSRNNNNE